MLVKHPLLQQSSKGISLCDFVKCVTFSHEDLVLPLFFIQKLCVHDSYWY